MDQRATFLGRCDAGRGCAGNSARAPRTACTSAHASLARDAAASTSGPAPTRITISAPCSSTPAAPARSPETIPPSRVRRRGGRHARGGIGSRGFGSRRGRRRARRGTRARSSRRPRRRTPGAHSALRRSALLGKCDGDEGTGFSWREQDRQRPRSRVKGTIALTVPPCTPSCARIVAGTAGTCPSAPRTPQHTTMPAPVHNLAPRVHAHDARLAGGNLARQSPVCVASCAAPVVAAPPHPPLAALLRLSHPTQKPRAPPPREPRAPQLGDDQRDPDAEKPTPSAALTFPHDPKPSTYSSNGFCVAVKTFGSIRGDIAASSRPHPRHSGADFSSPGVPRVSVANRVRAVANLSVSVA